MIYLIQIGKNKDKFYDEKIKFYTKQIKNFKIISLKDSNKKKEKQEILSEIKKIDNPYVFVLSEEGKKISSKEFSKKINELEMNYKNLIFCIAGPNGFEKPIKFGDEILSLSEMTFTHDMCQLFLIEQIYRAKSILEGKNYHKD